MLLTSISLQLYCFMYLPTNLVHAMRTTLSIDDQLLNLAKHQAVEQGISLSAVIENLLRQSLLKPGVERKAVHLVTAAGSGVKPGVDLDNGGSLIDIMDDPE